MGSVILITIILRALNTLRACIYVRKKERKKSNKNKNKNWKQQHNRKRKNLAWLWCEIYPAQRQLHSWLVSGPCLMGAESVGKLDASVLLYCTCVYIYWDQWELQHKQKIMHLFFCFVVKNCQIKDQTKHGKMVIKIVVCCLKKKKKNMKID